MATSGSYDYSVSAANIIQAALEDIGALQDGASVSSGDSTLCLRRLNFIAKQIQGKADRSPGLKVWTRQRITLILAKGQQTYTIGPATTDSRASTQMGRTTLSAAEASGETTISITSNTDTTSYPGTTITMTAADFIGVQQDDGTVHWSAISGTPGATATITVATTAAASSGNYVYWFTARAQRFPVIEFANLREADGTDTPLYIYREVAEYEGLPDKQADGDPTSVLVEPQRLNTRLTFDSQPDDVEKRVILTVMYPAEDYDATTDDIAFPQEAFGELEWTLALNIAPAFGRTWTKEMQANYERATAIASNVNYENTSAYFEPGRD